MNKYITQNMTKYIDYNHFKETFQGNYSFYFDEKTNTLNFKELYNIKYLMIVAEPGYGKTRLLKQFVLQGNENNKKIYFIDSKKIHSSIIEAIQKCEIVDSNLPEEQLQKKSLICNAKEYTLGANTIICLDALDELPFSNLYSFFEQIEEFISKYPDIKLFLSCRTHHLQKIEYDLSNIAFEYITLDRFNKNQIIDYLTSSNFSQKEIKEIEDKSRLTNLFDFLSVPRYLYYFTELIKNKKIDEIINLSRIEMFDYFVYRKINKERDITNYSESENYTIKRVLEELALVMKIYQVSQITKDEFFTIFRELNLSNIFTGQNLLEKLFDKSVLKDNINYLEFENQEFLDFLAAKELSRFEKVEQVFFDIAVEPHLKEVFASWFYIMPFVLEQQPFMINIILDFLEKNSSKVLREKYFSALTSIGTKFLDTKLKSRIFNLVFDYHIEHYQWLTDIDKLVYFYNEEEHYPKVLKLINSKIDDTDIKKQSAIKIVEELSKHNLLKEEQLHFWKDKFLEWLKLDVKQYRNLHRTIISSCSVIMKNDFDWIKSIDFIFYNGIEVQHEYSKTCNTIEPNNTFSIDIYFETDKQFKKNQINRAGRLDNNVKYICKVNTLEGIKYILEKLTSDNSEQYFRYIFSKSYQSSFKDNLRLFVSNIKNIINNEIIRLLKKLILDLLVKTRKRYDIDSEYLFNLIFELIMKKNPDYIYEFINIMYELYKKEELNYWGFEGVVTSNLSKYFNYKNFDKIYTQLKRFEKDNRTLENMMCYRFLIDENCNEKVKEKIKEIYKKELQENEKSNQALKTKKERDTKNRQLGLCKQWKHKIKPEPGKFMIDLFSFYLQNKDSLKQCKNFKTSRSETIEQAKKVIKFNNPLDGEVEVNGSISTIKGVHYYKKAIKLLDEEKVSLEQDLTDNIFRYLPFDINSEYEITLKLAKDPSSEAIKDILNVYAGNRNDDLSVYNPQNFVEIYKRTKIKEAEPLLLKMLYDNAIEDYVRKQIIELLPKAVLTKDIIEKYINDNGKKDVLYENMLIVLIEKFNDKSSLEKAFKIIIKKGLEAKISDSESSIWGTVLDLDMGNNKLVHTLVQINYEIEKDKELLQIASNLRGEGKNLNGYFFEEIVFRHIKYLNHKNSFLPLQEIEKFIEKNRSKINIHWFEYRFAELKDIYLKELSKPKHIMEAIRSYKKSKENEYISVNSPLHLLEILKESISNEIKQWIEIEGAYKHIEELAKKNTNINAEDFIQKTLKSQIELTLLKKGLRDTDIKIKREEQTLDDKRADFTINYGFIGSVLLEFKLSSNQEALSGNVAKKYKEKLQKYIGATDSNYGIFIVFNIKKSKVLFKKQISKLTELYDNEQDIFILGIDCKI